MRPLLAVAPLLFLAGCESRTDPVSPPAPAFATEAVTYPSGKDRVRAVLYRPDGEGPFPAVVVVHGDFGLTVWVKDQARRLARRGYVALAVDLYRGATPGDLMDAHILDRGLPDERALGDLQAAVDYLAGRVDVRRAAVGIIGWDMGGGYALDAALKDHRLRAVVTCYGRLTTDARLLASLRASVLGLFGGEDEGITAETIHQFRAAMRKAGKRVAGLHIYPKCGHGFMSPDRAAGPNAANTRAAADAWNRIDRYLGVELRR